MPQIIPREVTNAPTNITHGVGMAIGQGLQAVAGFAGQVEGGRRQAEQLEMKIREQQEKNDAERAMTEKHRLRLHAEAEIKKNTDPLEYIDALDKWENDYDSKLLAGKSKVFTDSFMSYDRNGRIYGLNRMSSDMERAILDQNIATFESSINAAGTQEELVAAIERGREKGISERVLNATLESQSKRIEEDNIYSALNSGDSEFARELLSSSGTLDEKRKREISNVIDAEVNRAERERLANLLDNVTPVDNEVVKMLAAGKHYSEVKSYVEANTEPGTWARDLAMGALESRVSKPESKAQDTMDRFAEYQADINARVSEMIMSEKDPSGVFDKINNLTEEGSVERELMTGFAKRFVNEPEVMSSAVAPAMFMAEQFNNNENIEDISATLLATDPTKPERFAAEAMFRKLVGESHDEWSNKSNIQKQKFQGDIFHKQLDSMSYDITSYISANKSKNYATLDMETLSMKMQSMARMGLQIRQAYESGRISVEKFGELNSIFTKRVIDVSMAAQGKSGEMSKSLPFTHLQSMVEQTYSRPDIPLPVLDRYRNSVYTQLASSGNNILTTVTGDDENKSIEEAELMAVAFHSKALESAYKAYGLTDEQARAEMKNIGLGPTLSDPVIQGSLYYQETIKDGLARRDQLVDYVRKSGLGYTDEEIEKFIDSYQKSFRTSTQGYVPRGAGIAANTYVEGWKVMFEAIDEALDYGKVPNEENIFWQDLKQLGKNGGN